jgi:hypothetical protein
MREEGGMRNFKWLFLLILILAGCAQKTATLKGYEKSAVLSLKFIPGESKVYKQTVNTVTTVEAMGATQTVNSAMDIKLTETVEDTVKFIKLKMGFSDVSATTRVGTEVIPLKEVEELEGKTVNIKLSKDGKLIETKGFEGLGYFEKEGKPKFEDFFGFLPQGKVSVGDKWTKESEGEKTTYILKGFEEKGGFTCARISMEKEIEKTRNTKEKGMTVKINLKGKAKGEILFAINEGMIIDVKSSASLEGEQEISGLQKPMTLPLYIDQTSHIKFLP